MNCEDLGVKICNHCSHYHYDKEHCVIHSVYKALIANNDIWRREYIEIACIMWDDYLLAALVMMADKYFSQYSKVIRTIILLK